MNQEPVPGPMFQQVRRQRQMNLDEVVKKQAGSEKLLPARDSLLYWVDISPFRQLFPGVA